MKSNTPTEFDAHADRYSEMLDGSIGLSGETSDFFAEYKIIDIARDLTKLEKIPKKILDFGCGIGSSIPHFKKHFPSAVLSAADVSKASLDHAKLKYTNSADFVFYDGATLPFEDCTFDVVFTACVFHHIPSSEHIALFKEIRRILRDDGNFYIFEHNPLNPLTVRTVNNCPFDKDAVLIPKSHLHMNLSKAGFNNIHGRYRIFFPNFLRFLRPFEALLSWCPAGAQYYLCAKK